MDGKLHSLVGDNWVKHSFAPLYWRDNDRPAEPRVVASVPDGDVTIILRLLTDLDAPFRLLYILHTPRGENEAARYESPILSRSELESFLNRFGDYLGNDGRHDL
jgi:hypothetical protein